MSFWNTIKIALRSLGRNKMRSFLTMLGVIIGVAAVIAMLAIGQGAKDSINATIASMGTNVVMIFSGAASQGGVRMDAGSGEKLEEDDMAAIKKLCPSVAYVSPIVRTGQQIKSANQNWRSTVFGVYPEYLTIRDWSLELGAMFSDADVRSGVKVCVVGKTLISNLFDGNAQAAIGQSVRIKGIPFTVIGVLTEKGQNAMGQDQDDVVLAPFSTIQRKMLGQTHAQQIIASAKNIDVVETARTEIGDALVSRRRGLDDASSAFTIRTQTEISEMFTKTSQTMSMLLAAIALVSLLVGGIGIMNIMLVSVTERTREIGIRMAVGARGKDVLMQFLIEAMTMSFAGGLFGIALGAGISYLLSSLQNWPVTISPLSIALGFGFSAAIGIFFGWYPARKAARLKPIEALRYE